MLKIGDHIEVVGVLSADPELAEPDDEYVCTTPATPTPALLCLMFCFCAVSCGGGDCGGVSVT